MSTHTTGTAFAIAFSGQVTATSPSPESIDYALVTISFKNEGRVAARVVRYEVVWTEGQGGRHEGKGPDEAIAPGEAREWKVKINEGDYHMLMAKPASAGVSVIETAL